MESNRDGYGLTRHQQHVVAHVVECELLGFGFLKNEAVFVLDIPFIWSIAVDGSMDLGSSDDMSSRLELDEDDRIRLTNEAQNLRDGTAEESETNLFSELPALLRVNSVTCKVITDSQVETAIKCDHATVIITSDDGAIRLNIE